MKYYRTLLLALQSQMISVVNTLGWLVVGCLPTAALVLVWFAILGDNQTLGGFTKGDFIVYYIFTIFGWYIVGGIFARAIGDGIKNGDISISLLKPYNVIFAAFVKEQAFKIVGLVAAFPPTLVVLYIFRDLIHLNLTSEQIFLLIISLILGGINFALMEAIVGMSAFWTTEVWSIDNLKTIATTLFGGLAVPLTLMPSPLLNLANLLPFKYMFYVPLSILLSKTNNPLLDIVIQLGYILVLFLLFKIVWKFGIKRYEAIGS